ncbi:energy-coupling factor transport system substrate-specific component [Brachybacterium muris]|uniref:hypothetical protein n=1 Tax=Brachybacterium muris TaxID=219301 RepID=UPI001956B786|nr:hypothetical protein [Brachybacterium muris]MBM7500557.1 energy-coupling factor transport system substrate-specific component [Brachybacterium muris]
MSAVEGTDSYDALAEDLRALRHAAGSPSFTEIAVRVGQVREARGTDPGRARPARTTVYDTFRAGRSRMDGALVADIAEALDAPDPRSWRDRCGRIQHALEESRLRPIATDDVDDEPTRDPTPDAEPGPVPAADPLPPAPADPAPAQGTRLLLLAGCVVLNLVGILVIRATGLPLYFDTIGIAVAALALVWGYVWRHLRQRGALTPPIGLHLLVGLCCSVVATPMLWLRFHGFGGHTAGQLQNIFNGRIEPEWVTVFLTNLSTSMPDKLLSGVIAVAVIPVALRVITRITKSAELAAAPSSAPAPRHEASQRPRTAVTPPPGASVR